jgi:hypothetical protein
MKIKYVVVFALIGFLAILSSMPVLSSGIVTNYASAKYATNTQTLVNNNECDNGANCANPSAQSIGDGTANSPVNTQISKFNEEQESVVGAESCIVTGLCELTLESCSRQAVPEIACIIVLPNDGRLFCNLVGRCDVFMDSRIGRDFICEPPPVESTQLQRTTCHRQ